MRIEVGEAWEMYGPCPSVVMKVQKGVVLPLITDLPQVMGQKCQVTSLLYGSEEEC